MATETKYLHAEAFCHMQYATDDGRETEIIWNSRDGVTPFMLTSRSGKHMQHVNWRSDRCDPDYKPKKGDRIFVTATRELVLPKVRKYVDEWWDAPEYPMSKMFDSKDAAIEQFVKEWTRDGSPWLLEVTDETRVIP